mmetsp:Transcript_5167/g.6764  ORF Transcript_5167/g.6764 Transcript_5167/m.6764 type:complete len:383 (-) Transcript_5167:195-1343(-)
MNGPPGVGFQANPANSPGNDVPLHSQMSQGSTMTGMTGLTTATGQTFVAKSMSVKELRQVLTDFYDYHDPFKGPDEITDVVNWTKRNGIKRLNKMLRKKYKEDLLVRDDVVTNRESIRSNARAVSTLMTPGLVPPDMEEDYDAVGVRRRRGTVVEEVAMRKMLDNSIKALENCKTPDQIKNEILNFYSIVQPDRLQQVRRGEIPDFTTEILQWTFRFGLPNLVKNLREKYLGEFGEIEAPAVFRIDELKEGEPKQLPANLPPVDIGQLREKLLAFYGTYNPQKLQEGIEDLIKYVKKKGVEPLNKKLRARYNDDLDTFQGQDVIEYKKKLFERLVGFYGDHDPSMIGNGLAKIIAWAEKRGEEKLNYHLREKYNADLSTYQA